ALASERVAAIVEKAIVRDDDLGAAIGSTREPALAFPVIARVAQVAVGRHFHGAARLTTDPKAAFAFPAPAIHRLHEKTVGRHDDLRALVVPFAKAPIAAPPGAIGGVVRMRVAWHHHGHAGARLLTEAAHTFPVIARRIQESIRRHLDLGT